MTDRPDTIHRPRSSGGGVPAIKSGIPPHTDIRRHNRDQARRPDPDRRHRHRRRKTDRPRHHPPPDEQRLGVWGEYPLSRAGHLHTLTTDATIETKRDNATRQTKPTKKTKDGSPPTQST